jgi:hypothetical protein
MTKILKNKRNSKTTKFDLSRQFRETKFLTDSVEIHGDLYDYSLVPGTFKNVDTPVKIICLRCKKIFLQIPYNHINQKKGCKSCNISESLRLPDEDFLFRTKEKFGDKFKYSTYKGMGKKIKITCSDCEYVFNITPEQHLKTSGCYNCNEVVKDLSAFIIKSKRLHLDKFSYERVVFGPNHIKVEIFCKKCKVYFWQSINNHLSGLGHQKCASKECGFNRRKIKNTDDFIRQAIDKHGNNFAYDKVNFISPGEMVEIFCNKHQYYFLQAPNNHIKGSICPKCYGELSSLRQRKSQGQFIDECNTRHGIDKYSYEKVVYLGQKIKVEIICFKHGSFWQNAASHLGGNGCPECAATNSSKVEKEWLDHIGIDELNRQKRLPGLGKRRMDGFYPLTNTVYQFHGDYWHGNPEKYSPEKINKRNEISFGKLYSDTIDADRKIVDAGYNLITIWESDWSKFKKRRKQDERNTGTFGRNLATIS